MKEVETHRREIEERERPHAPLESDRGLNDFRIHEFDDLTEVDGGPPEVGDFDRVDEVAGAVRSWEEVYRPRWDQLSGEGRHLALARLEEGCARMQGGRATAEVRTEDLSIPSNHGGVEIAGDYDPEDHTIRLEKSLSFDESMATAVHEGRHAYQRWAVESANGDPRTVEWAKNFEHPLSPHDDPQAYWEQPLETDAYDYERAVMSRVGGRR